MDVLTDVIRMLGARVRELQCVTIPGQSEWLGDTAADAIAIYTPCDKPVRVQHSTEGAIDVGVGEAVFLMGGANSIVSAERDAKPVQIVVGRFEFGASLFRSEMIGWPVRMVLGATEDRRGLVGCLAEEVRAAEAGWETIAAGLVQAMLVLAVRGHRAPASSCPAHGWLRGLADSEVGAAVRMMHERPAHPWTVAELADRLSISRSGFAARFKQVTGRPPLTYLTWWRLCSAATRLRSRDGTTIAQISREVGYESEAAFGKAFRRQFGRTPGQVRLESGAPPAATPLQLELKKRNPFEVREQEVGINLRRTAAKVEVEFQALFGAQGITGGQYNVLRILRGEGASLPMTEVRSRLVVDDDGLGESVSSLVSAGLVEREASERVRITRQGDAVLKRLDGPVVDLHRRQLAHFSAAETAELNRLLVKVRRPDH